MSDKPQPVVRYRLPIREIHGHVTATSGKLTAWYVLHPQRWAFRTDGERDSLITSYARQLASLSGHDVVVRTTDRPYAAAEWARQIHKDTDHPLPGVPGNDWKAWLTDAQQALLTGTSSKVTFVGIDIDTRTPLQRTAAYLRGTDGALVEVEKHAADIDYLTEIVSGPGMGGRPAETSEIEWLLHRSLRIGLPTPKELSTVTEASWALDDMAAFTDNVRYYWDRWAPTVKVEATYNETVKTSHVAIVTFGRMPELTVPQTGRDPWLQFTDRFDFPVEILQRFTVLDGDEITKRTKRKRLGIREMQKHYKEHDSEEPLDLDSQAQRARRIEWEARQGDVTASRAYGWHRLAISAPTEADCLKRVRAVTRWYAEKHQITLRHPRGIQDAAAQWPLFQEFVPGSVLSSTAYQRRLKTEHVAAALPHATSSVGDDRGPVIGHTVTGNRPVMFDGHYAMEQADMAGLVPIVGGLGAGKSTLIGKISYDAIKRGIPTTILDPAALLANLATMADLRDHVGVVDVVDGDEGILSPYAVIGDPTRDEYPDEDAYRDGLHIAAMSRRMLAVDVMNMLLPKAMQEQASTSLVLAEAARSVGGDRDASLWLMLDALRKVDDPHGKVIADYVNDLAEMPFARLFFGNHVHDEVERNDTGLVVAMHGLQLPLPGNAPSTLAERLSVPVLHLATHYATRRVYGLPRIDRKVLALDEAGLVAEWGSGRAMYQQVSRNSRKWNLLALAASQDGKDILNMDVANFISTAFVGRTEDEETAAANLRLLGVPEKHGYEAILQGLSPLVESPFGGTTARGAREFVMRDVRKRVEKIRIDTLSPALLAALYTTPGSKVTNQEGVYA